MRIADATQLLANIGRKFSMQHCHAMREVELFDLYIERSVKTLVNVSFPFSAAMLIQVKDYWTNTRSIDKM
jgi:hypothetical protein